MEICIQTRMLITSQVGFYNMGKYKTKKINIIKLEAFYKEIIKKDKKQNNGKRNLSS